MKTITITDQEHKILKTLIDSRIEDFKKNGGDPFIIADVINLFRKLDDTPQPLITKAMPIVVHGNEMVIGIEPLLPIVKPAIGKQPKMPPLKIPKNKIIITEGNVTPDNIDAMTDALLPEDSLEDELNIEKPKVKK